MTRRRRVTNELGRTLCTEMIWWEEEEEGAKKDPFCAECYKSIRAINYFWVRRLFATDDMLIIAHFDDIILRKLWPFSINCALLLFGRQERGWRRTVVVIRPPEWRATHEPWKSRGKWINYKFEMHVGMNTCLVRRTKGLPRVID